MPFLTFYGGVGEIGGNKILLEDRDVRLWFDFGQPFDYGANYFVDWLTPRRLAGCKDHFEFGLLPKILGLYRRDLLRETDLRYVAPRFDGVFLSHAHVDHMAHISFLDERIPVYLGEATKTLIKCQETTSFGANYGEHGYRTFKTGDMMRIGHLEVEPIHVDHSIPGAYGFIIHTGKGAVVYTGDIRMHGPMAKMTREFVERARQVEPVCLITEGTRVASKDKRKNISEEQVLLGATRIAKKCQNLVLASCYGRDIDRLKTFCQVAKESGRELVIPPRIAYLLSKLARHMKVPDITKGEMHVLFKRKKSGTYDDSDYYPWERPFLDQIITAEEIRRKQVRYLVHLSFYDFAEMIDIRPLPGSDFIHSQSEPFTEEDLNWDVMHNWLKHFKFRFHQLHASGHASRSAISSIIRTVKPKRVAPIHTEYPELFKSISGNVKIDLLASGSKREIS